ncbi:hypothetical protein BKA70DRAFT_1215233 [Coprinopsis sp. MPI-PUGE-AT-0042]|nr:hypothetical protein BKA70DRAFT_1215233 [Coprinopsis sp. MPI-PUGE-AT-0042]
MFQVPHPAHQQYLAAQAEARAAQARADAAKAEYLAQQAILQEEAVIKARLYELEQRKRYGSSATHFTPNGYTWPLQPTLDVPSDYSIEFPSFSYTAPHSLGRALPSAHPPYQPYQAPRLDLLLQREQEEQEALEHLRKEKAARLEAERERLRKEQESILAQLAAKKELERKKQEIKTAQATPQAANAYYVCNPWTSTHRQGTRLPCSHPNLKAVPIKATTPRAPQPRKPEEAAVATEEDLKAFFTAIFGALAPAHATTPVLNAHPQPPHPKPQQRSSNVPQLKAHTPPAQEPAASGESLVDQLKARYEAPSDEEIKDTIFAVIDFFSERPAVKETPKPAPTITKKPSSLVEQLQARSSSQTKDQELRDTIQATINSLLPELNKPPSPSASSSSRKDKAKATPPATPSVESRLDKVRHIRDEFRKFESEFVFPSQLDFVPTADASSTALAHLAFTARNHPVRFYEQCLASLLVELDSIESQGDATLRSKRKETVRHVEQALETLEQEITSRWKAKKAKEELTRVAAPQADEAETSASFTIPILDGSSKVPAEDTPVDELPESAVVDSALSTVDRPLLPSSEEVGSHPQPATEEPQLDDPSTPDSQLTTKPEEDTPFVPELEHSPLPFAALLPEAEVESLKEAVEDSDNDDGSLLAQTDSEAEEERLEQKSKKAHGDDIGSDWSELDAWVPLSVSTTLTCVPLMNIDSIACRLNTPVPFYNSRDGRFGTEGLAITFVSSGGDQQVTEAIQRSLSLGSLDISTRNLPATTAGLSIYYGNYAASTAQIEKSPLQSITKLGWEILR